MHDSFAGYSAAQRLRTGGPAAVRDELIKARGRTLLLADAYADALAARGLAVPYRPELNPPLWEWGHVAWFQEWWVGRNRERDGGVACDPGHVRGPSLMRDADALYDSGKVPHASRWDLPLPNADETRQWLAATLADTLRALDRLDVDAGDDELYFFRLTALHEAMHAEAACYMAKTLSIPVPPGALAPSSTEAREGAVLKIDAQDFVAGWQGPGFAFDNELGPVHVRLDAFEIDSQPISWSRFCRLRGSRWLSRKALVGRRRLGLVATKQRAEPRRRRAAGRPGRAPQPPSKLMHGAAGRAGGCRPNSNGNALLSRRRVFGGARCGSGPHRPSSLTRVSWRIHTATIRRRGFPRDACCVARALPPHLRWRTRVIATSSSRIAGT